MYLNKRCTRIAMYQKMLYKASNISLIGLYPISGTIFLEVWKRRNATLAYQWDVDNFEDTEPDRPQFYGTQKKPVNF